MERVAKHPLRIGLIVLTAALLFFLAAFRFQRREQAHSHRATVNRLSQLPTTVLWAWERPEKLDFVDAERVGVAFLAKTIYLRAARVITRPRLQPLTLPVGAGVIAVARIESDRETPPTLSAEQIKSTASEIAALGNLPSVVMVQVDFDATKSERDFYRALLKEVRTQLPSSTLVSITALASWCKGDNWLEDLPIDEAVPMLFRMGVERKQFLSQLAAGGEFTAKPCRNRAGVSIDEPLTQLPPVERLYVFNPRAWSPDTVNQMMESYER